MTCGGGQSDHEDKQLLHWVNSLPVASCLLVDSFDQLRSGDVFCDIFRLVHHNENDGVRVILGPPAQKLQTVLTSVLQLVSAAEWSHRYLLREPETILDILDGSQIAIATLLRALKKRWDLVARQVQHRDKLDAQLQRQIEKQLPLPAAARQPKSPPHGWNPSTQQSVKASTKRVPETPSARPCARSTPNRGHRRMVDAADAPYDPRALGATPKTTRATDLAEFSAHMAETKRATAFAICKWIRSLGIALGFEASLEKATASSFLTSAANAFKDGVIICQLTAVAVYHLGASSAKAKLRPVAAQPGTFVPQGCCLQPVTLAQKRHNLQLALHLLREIPEVTHPVVCALDLYDPLASAFDKHIWTLLRVLYKLSRNKERSPPPSRDRPVPSPPPAPPTERSGSKNEVVFPSVSSEQVHAVRDWLQHLGLDASSTSTGLLADPYRNGSFLCDVLNRLVARDRELTFHRSPKTLHQAKANLQAGFHCLHAQRISLPPLYWSLEHGYGLLKGHFHAVYGFWWHLQQSLQASTPVTPPAPPAIGHELGTRKILVAEWLRAKGFLNDLRTITATQQHWSFEMLKPCLVNGTLLLAMALALTQSRNGVCHVVLDPMPTSVARAHIAEALEHLRSMPSMPQRFLWCEDKVRAGDDVVLLGLLEDLQSLGDTPEVAAPRRGLPRAVVSTAHLLPIREEDDDDATDAGSTNLECVHTQAAISSSRQWREIDIDTDFDLLPRAHADGFEIEEEARPPSLPSPQAPPQFIRRQSMGPQPVVANAALPAVETELLTTWLEHLQIKPIPRLEVVQPLKA
ncbi:hypothetical protein SDRG_07461 [Saprolegnia diclina VS20]|uniref:Calponin-homology (CH) domain-containing protein n=1 Tax=Saprolegnia diclina (strain VS20) TaxID=1156394 RepID=T0RRU7_SAPDV|nr:hypothetical protein SDRG_07461 [Saprolegnia diclina VS20]EQC35233.1 hypothetical protein SDRG_07461 [Saprolegnia diclina VS20]|eukprot:XP_008611517.1 hypothetical protein SDRG_07461 [Saprolegnia diclina VS20]